MFIPLGTDRTFRRRPRAVGALIVINMVIYLAGLVLDVLGAADLEGFMHSMGLSRGDLSDGALWQLITYQFAHSPDDIFHLGANMLFLWIFGSALEDRLGHVNVVLFILMGGVVAGIAHTMESANYVIGASGAVCAATGGFVVFMPRARIRILVIFFLIGVFMIPAMWVVAFQVLLDVVGWIQPAAPVAYAAHLAGYAFGLMMAALLIATGLIKSDEFDLLYLIKQRRRRAVFRRVVNHSGVANRGASVRDSDMSPRSSTDSGADSSFDSTLDPADRAAQQEVMRLIRADRFDEAQQAFRTWQTDNPKGVLPESMQLEIANRLQVDGDRQTAASAYDRFLQRYPGSRHAPEVRLLLASLLIRFLNRPTEARPHLEQAMPDLRSDSHRELARRLLSEATA